MGQCKCGHTRDAEENCDGTHKVVKAVREQIAADIEDLIDPPPIDEIDYIIVDVIKRCADVARGNNNGRM
jgi:hypothetical protein